MDDMKRCPQCGAMVKAIAVKCRYCGFWFATPNEQFSYQQPQQPQQPQPQQQWQGNYQQNQEQQYQQHQYQQQYQQPQPQRPFAIRNSNLTIENILMEGISLGLSKFGTVFGAIILWLLTIWIPYLNVGTTIAINTMPITLADNQESQGPTYIFDGKYRKYMGEYFTLIGLKSLSLGPAFLFMIIPGIIISLGWSMALYLLFDKHISPGESLIQSSEKTDGHKMILFIAGVLYNLAFFIVIGLVLWLTSLLEVPVITFIFLLALIAVYMVGNVGCQAVIYHKLCKNQNNTI